MLSSCKQGWAMLGDIAVIPGVGQGGQTSCRQPCFQEVGPDCSVLMSHGLGQALLLSLVNLALQQSMCIVRLSKEHCSTWRLLTLGIHLGAERLKLHGEVLQQHLCRQVQALWHTVRRES